MAVPFSEFPENPLYIKTLNKISKNQNVEKLKKTNPNLNSLWAFMSSILIYIYVFYVFNLSPSTLICTTKFWFFISNTLILIVALDFAAFSRHEWHMIKSKGNIIIEEHVAKEPTATLSKCHVIEEHVAKDTTATSSKWHVIVNDTSDTSSKGGTIVPFEKEEENPKEKIINAVYDHHQKKRQRCARSNSENAAVVAAATAVEEEAKVMVLHRTLSERHDRGLLEDDKINEFSRMSNEEVNRRVEEFIRRFNREIRLQAVSNPQNLEMN